jgi:hypothetical protein
MVPPLSYLDIDGQIVDPYSVDFVFIGWNHIWRMDDLRKLALLPNLRSASFRRTNLDDIGLGHVARSATLETLDLQDTKISDDGLAQLAGHPRLRAVLLTGNQQLTSRCVTHLARLANLADLQIHGTGIDERGLADLEGVPGLRNVGVDVRDNNYTFNGLLTLSARMPRCIIRADGRGAFSQGQFEGQWGLTEQRWLASAAPREMLEHLRGKVGGRKVRLFAVACCRNVWGSLNRDEFRRAVEAAEGLADGLVDGAGLARARRAALDVFAGLRGNDDGPGAAISAACLPAEADASAGEWWEDELDRGDPLAPAVLTSRHAARAAGDDLPGMLAEYQRQAVAVRCIFGNPFRPAAFDTRWRTADVLDLARGVYEDRAFDRLPPLADALMDAGCDSEDILAHCRSGGPHVRGCWVVDLVLGKA